MGTWQEVTAWFLGPHSVCSPRVPGSPEQSRSALLRDFREMLGVLGLLFFYSYLYIFIYAFLLFLFYLNARNLERIQLSHPTMTMDLGLV